jgi:hypothetical protein
VNTPVVIFVEQMLLVQEIQFWRRIIVRTGILNFQKFFWEILLMVKGSFLFDHNMKNVIATSPIATLSYKPSIINKMPFDAAQLTAFWTSPDQMGLSARTCTQMASKGLVTPANFEDFSERSDLDALVKLLLKPAKVPRGAAGNLREVKSYAIPAKSPIQIDGARKMVLYYTLVGCPMEAADMMWPVIKNFVEQWKALMEKKKADIGLPPELTKDKLVYKWLEQLNQYLM